MQQKWQKIYKKKNHDFQEQINVPGAKNCCFFQKKKIDRLNKFFGNVSHTLRDAMALLGMESLRAAKCV
jgi:hypothetical protein